MLFYTDFTRERNKWTNLNGIYFVNIFHKQIHTQQQQHAHRQTYNTKDINKITLDIERKKMKSEANLEIFKHNDNELILNRWKFNDIIKYFVNCGNCSKKNLGTWKLYWLKQLGTAVDRSLIVAEIICLLVGQSIKRIKKNTSRIYSIWSFWIFWMLYRCVFFSLCYYCICEE